MTLVHGTQKDAAGPSMYTGLRDASQGNYKENCFDFDE